MKIGEIQYDSVSGSLMIRSWDNAGQLYTAFQHLYAGDNTITLPHDRKKFTFTLTKWGSKDELTLETKDIVADSVYKLGADKAAKKLKIEYEYIFRNNTYEAQSKIDYTYNTSGNLEKIVYNRKRLDGRPYISMVSQFSYQGSKVARIDRFDENNSSIGFTTFNYNAAGKVSAIKDRSGQEETLASVAYSRLAGEEVNIQYTYPGKTYTMGYYMQFFWDNLAYGNATTSHHSNETGRYEYDENINPYFHMNWPDLYLSHSSKNNVKRQSQSFYGSYPTAVPSGYTYSYDSDGYPKELIRTYKSGITNEYLYTTKTVFVY
jgi:hypothetical protein